MSKIARNVLNELDALHRKPGGSSQAEVWSALTQAAQPGEFAVGLDYAQELGLISADFAMAVQGQFSEETARKSWVNPFDQSEMIWIPPGRFQFGDKREIAVSGGCFLGRYPITTKQFRQFLDATNYLPAADDVERGKFLSQWNNRRPPPTAREQHPAVYVSLIDAMHYCRWSGSTLPTELLWEKAARGDDGREYPWGDTPPWGSYPKEYKLAWVNETDTCPVGQFERVRTPYGCEEMVGNVSEWCLPSEDGPGTEPPLTAPDVLLRYGSLAPIRGSCYLRKAMSRMAAVHRRQLSPLRRNQWVGFRPAFCLSSSNHGERVGVPISDGASTDPPILR